MHAPSHKYITIIRPDPENPITNPVNSDFPRQSRGEFDITCLIWQHLVLCSYESKWSKIM
jgi:hypothetical protein